MKIRFYKYQGTGNDFIIVDNRDKSYDQITEAEVKHLCNRHFGIGADGLMLLNLHKDFDFEMIYYNSDGRPSTMCGNGGRCLVKFANDVGMVQSNYKFLAADGPHEASVDMNGIVSLKMKDVEEINFDHGNFILDTGSPHYVTIITDLLNQDIIKKARNIRNSEAFREKGINVNFVEQTEDPDKIIVRTYERGVEDETLSCGTGVTAAAVVCAHNDNGFNRVEVQTRGGRLSVEYDKIGDRYENIWLSGPAIRVFDGILELNHI